MGDEFANIDVGEDIAIVNEDRIIADEGTNVADAAAGFEQHGLVIEAQWRAMEAALWVSCWPRLGNVVRVDGKFLNANRLAEAQGVIGHGLMEDRNQRLGQDVGEGT